MNNRVSPGRRDEEPRGRHGTRTGPGGRRRSQPLVLAIEDNPHDWEIYGKLLWYNGYQVEHAADGQEGLRMARDLHPDLILLDLTLPKLDGLSLCRRIRQDPAMAEVPVVALTGHAWKKFGEKAKKAGCTRYLEKPIGPVDVFHEVERLIGPPESND